MKYLILITGCSISLLSADTLTLHPVADTSLFQTDPNNNFGAVTELPAGTTRAGKKSRMLLRFDLAGAMPSNAVVSAAALNLTVVKAPSTSANSRFDLRRVLQNWGEGTNAPVQHGSLAKAGDSSWNSRLAPSTPWSTPGGSVGVDYSTNVSSSASITRLGTFSFASTSNLVQDAQQWLQDPASNFGWVLMTEAETTASTARRFGSREAGKNAAALTLTFSVPQPAVAP